MTDRYRIAEPDERPEPAPKPRANGVDTVLWAVLIGGACVNTALSMGGLDLASIPFGAAAAAAGVALIVRYVRRRK